MNEASAARMAGDIFTPSVFVCESSESIEHGNHKL
jgi:hypothetical protein